MAPIKQLSSTKAYHELIESKKNDLFLIKLYTPWCTKCKHLESAIQQNPLKYDIYKIDIDSDPFIDNTEFESVSSLPCVWIFKNGKKIIINNANINVIADNLNKLV